MRTVFFLLVLANLAFIAWSYLGGPASGESQLVDQQLNPQAIRLLSPEQRAALAAERARPAPPPPPQAAPAAPPPPAAPKVAVVACMELGAFNLADVQRVEQALGPLSLGAKLSQRHAEEIAGYWVFIPPQPGRQAANRKATELKKLGVEDFFIVQEDSSFRYSISLGVFKTGDAAKARLEQLRTKGVKTARVGARDTTVQKVYFVVREVPEPLAAKLNELRQGFPGTELKECPTGTKRAAS
jgi:hypothetical protein